MPALHDLIARNARSEMSRNALNSWDKFKLPQESARIEDLLDKLRAPATDDDQDDNVSPPRH